MTELEQVKAERDAIAAQAEAFRKALEYADNKLYILTHNREDVSPRLIGDADKAFKMVRDTLSLAATPEHRLRELREESEKAGADDFIAFLYGVNHGKETQVSKWADQYAARRKNGK